MDTTGFTPARITALAVITLTALALGYLGVRDTTPPAAKAGTLTLRPCTYDTESGALPAASGSEPVSGYVS